MQNIRTREYHLHVIYMQLSLKCVYVYTYRNSQDGVDLEKEMYQ